MGLDGLGSAAYGPEAMLTVLAVVGARGPEAPCSRSPGLFWSCSRSCSSPIGRPSQPIPATAAPTRSPARTLAPDAGLLAAAALMVDYMLNVAVGISAGVGALTSAVAGPARLHAAAVPGHPGRHHRGEPARHQGVRHRACCADLPVRCMP